MTDAASNDVLHSVCYEWKMEPGTGPKAVGYRYPDGEYGFREKLFSLDMNRAEFQAHLKKVSTYNELFNRLKPSRSVMEEQRLVIIAEHQEAIARIRDLVAQNDPGTSSYRAWQSEVRHRERAVRHLGGIVPAVESAPTDTLPPETAVQEKPIADLFQLSRPQEVAPKPKHVTKPRKAAAPAM